MVDFLELRLGSCFWVGVGWIDLLGIVGIVWFSECY